MCVCRLACDARSRLQNRQLGHKKAKHGLLHFHSILIGARRAFRVLTEEFAFELRNDMQMKTLASNKKEGGTTTTTTETARQARRATKSKYSYCNFHYSSNLRACASVVPPGRNCKWTQTARHKALHSAYQWAPFPFLSYLPPCLPPFACTPCLPPFILSLDLNPFSLAARQRDVWVIWLGVQLI